MAAIKVYSDDSGDADDPQHSVISVAANLCSDLGWSQFEADWAALLRRFDVPYLHMREWVNPNSPIYRHLRDAESQALFFESLVTVIKNNIRYSAGASINLPDLRRFNKEADLNLEPYAVALYVAIIELRKVEPGAEIKLIIDKLNGARGKIELAKCYARSDVFDLQVGSIENSPLDKEESFRTILPMQVGNFFAWEMRKVVKSERLGLQAMMHWLITMLSCVSMVLGKATSS